jgi:hypothetical protein
MGVVSHNSQILGKLGVTSHYSRNDKQNGREAKTCVVYKSSRQLAHEREMREKKTVPHLDE